MGAASGGGGVTHAAMLNSSVLRQRSRSFNRTGSNGSGTSAGETGAPGGGGRGRSGSYTLNGGSGLTREASFASTASSRSDAGRASWIARAAAGMRASLGRLGRGRSRSRSRDEDGLGWEERGERGRASSLVTVASSELPTRRSRGPSR